MTDEQIAFLDLPAVTAPLREELDLAWKAVLGHGRYVGGPEVTRFESEFASYCEAGQCVGVANGTDALELILRTLGIGRGDEVIVPGNTFIATAEAVCSVGARPRFVDVLQDTLLIDPEAVAAAVRPSTAAVMAVHLYGQMVDVDRLLPIARRHGLAVVEDAAQSHGARFAGRRAGSVGTAAAFSFYPGKNLGALGDGGAVVTNDAELAATIRRLGDHGRSGSDRYLHDLRGRNSRLDSLQAAVLSAKLAGLDAANHHRRGLAARYRSELPASCPMVAVHPDAEAVHHLAVIQVEDRESVTRALSAAGIGWGLHYPVPCHRQPAFAEFGERLPVAEAAAARIVSLPISATHTTNDVARVVAVLRDATSGTDS